MATKAKSTRSKSSSRKQSKPRGLKRPVPHNPFAPGTKVGIYHAHEVGPERDLQREPHAKPLSTVTARDDGTVEFNVKDPGQYALAAPAKGREGWDYQIVSVNK